MRPVVNKILFAVALAISILFINPIEAKAGHCGGSVDDCGCGTDYCNNKMVCYYNSPWDYCDGHNFGDTWTYISTSATCTSQGSQHWRGYCSICQRWYDLYMSDGPLGHSYGSWQNYSITQHKASCVRCGVTTYGYHSMGNWYDGGDGWHYRKCNQCSYTEKKDCTAPSVSNFSATPNSWSSGNGTVTITARDKGSGLTTIEIYRTNVNTGASERVASYNHGGTTASVTDTYTEHEEGVYYYTAYLLDSVGNGSSSTSATIYLDHSNPSISGTENTNTAWTNVTPQINVSATDYLSGTSYSGSGVASVVIKDSAGVVVGRGTTSASYTLESKYEGTYTWTIVATDNVGHTSSKTVTTRYDITKPGIDGTETSIVHNGTLISGYLPDNIIDQSIDDKPYRSVNNPNQTSGLKSVILYKVIGTEKTVIYGSGTKATFDASDTNSSFHMYYELPDDEKEVAYYLIVVSDHAGNVAKKKLTSQQSLLTWFHTSIDGSTYR